MTEHKKPGRKPHQPTDETRAQVRALASFGTPRPEIARYIGVAENTLRKHYEQELELAETQANAAVGKFLYKAASGQAIRDGANHADCLRASMFWAKTRMGWKETDRTEHTGANGGPIKTEATIDPGGLSDSALAELMAARKGEEG